MGTLIESVLDGCSFSLLEVCNMVARFVKSECTGRRHCVKSPLILRVEVVCDGKTVYAACFFFSRPCMSELN